MIFKNDKGEISEGVGFGNPHFKRYIKQRAIKKLKAQDCKIINAKLNNPSKYKLVSDLKTSHDPENSIAKPELKRKCRKRSKKKTSSTNVDQSQRVVLTH